MVQRRGVVSALWFLACYIFEANGALHTSRLRTVLHGRQQPPLGMVAAAPGSAVADLFAKMDVNKDGKVEPNEFVAAAAAGVLGAAAPAGAAGVAASPGAAVAGVIAAGP